MMSPHRDFDRQSETFADAVRPPRLNASRRTLGFGLIAGGLGGFLAGTVFASGIIQQQRNSIYLDRVATVSDNLAQGRWGPGVSREETESDRCRIVVLANDDSGNTWVMNEWRGEREAHYIWFQNDAAFAAAHRVDQAAELRWFFLDTPLLTEFMEVTASEDRAE